MDDASLGQQRQAPSVRFFLPAAPLRDLISTYYIVDAPGPMADQLHPEWGNIRFTLSGVWVNAMAGRSTPTPLRSGLFGPTSRTGHFHTPAGGITLGVGLLPLGWATLIASDASLLANAVVELGSALGVDGDKLAAALAAGVDDAARVARLDALFIARAEAMPCAEPHLLAAHRALVDGDIADVEAFAAAAGVPVRSLNRLCRRVFGFAPKPLLRRQRFLRTLATVRNRLGEPISAALDDGYYNQAHFIRDFHAFMGMAPGAYYASPREVMRRAAEERQRIAGAPMQGLHVPA